MQGKNRIGILAVGLAALSFSSFSYAIMSVPDGWYLEVNAGSSHITNTSYPGSANASGVGGNVSFGYKFMPYVGAEVGFTQYSNTSIQYNGAKAGTVKNYSYDLAAKGILPVSDSGFEVFAKLGAERVNAHTTINNGPAAKAAGVGNTQRSATGLYIGLGAQYYFMPEFAANVQWASANGNHQTGTMNLISVGFSYIVD